MCLHPAGFNASSGRASATSEFFGVGIKNRLVDPSYRHPDPISMTDDRCGVNNDQQIVPGPGRNLAEERPDSVLCIMEVNPLESLWAVIEQR
jgi:hypothetical protein